MFPSPGSHQLGLCRENVPLELPRSPRPVCNRSGDTHTPAGHQNNRFLLKSRTKSHFIQLQSATFSEVERGSRGMERGDSTLRFIDHKRPFFHTPETCFSPNGKASFSPSPSLYSNQSARFKRWKDMKCIDLYSCWKASDTKRQFFCQSGNSFKSQRSTQTCWFWWNSNANLANSHPGPIWCSSSFSPCQPWCHLLKT